MMSMIQHIFAACKKARIQIRFIPSSFVWDEGEPVLGHFNWEHKTVVIAASHVNWYLTLAHEYGHVLQYLEHGVDFFENYSDACDLGAEGIKTVVLVEQDAEVRAQALCSQYGVIDGAEYAKLANESLWSYVEAHNPLIQRIYSEDIYTEDELIHMLDGTSGVNTVQ